MPRRAHPARRFWAAVFGTVARLRGARGLHPTGDAFHATLRVPGGRCPGVPLLGEGGEHPALVRLSRAAGLPEPLPDGLGLALRVPGAHGPGRDQDVLVTSTKAVALVQHLPLVTTRRPHETTYSSLVPFRLAGRLRLLGARPGEAGRFELCTATLAGRWAPVAEIVLGAPLAPADAEALAFDPLNTGGGIRPCRPLRGIRASAYAASRAARGGTAAARADGRGGPVAPAP
jgi:hypothetical protein